MRLPGYDLVEFGQVMRDYQATAGDEERSLSEVTLSRRVALQGAVVRNILQSMRRTLVVAHLLVEAPEGFAPGLQPDALRELELDGILLLVAPARDIDLRVRGYGGERPAQQQRRTALWQQLVRTAVVADGQQLGIPFAVIVNRNGHLNAAVEAAVAVVEAQSAS